MSAKSENAIFPMGHSSSYEPPVLTRNRLVPAWLLSLVLHTGIFLSLLLVVNSIPNGASKVENKAGGIVLVDMKSETTEYLDEGDVNESETSAATAQQSPPPSTTNTELPPDLPGMETNSTPISGVGKEFVEGLPGADKLVEGPSSNLKFGGKVTTEVFGVKGTGSKFVYVFDRSKSMEGYDSRPLMAARQALLQSLDSLGEEHQFQIVFYNNETKLFQPNNNELHSANKQTKEAATLFVNSVRGDGGTDHMNALKRALLFRPDVIFFLTDAEGGFSPRELQELNHLNRSAAVINAIEFGEFRGKDRSLEALSRENGGAYVFKNIRSLKVGN